MFSSRSLGGALPNIRIAGITVHHEHLMLEDGISGEPTLAERVIISIERCDFRRRWEQG